MNFLENKNLLSKDKEKEERPDNINLPIRKNYYDIEDISKTAFNGKKVLLVGMCGGQASGKSKIVSYFHEKISKSDCIAEKDFFILGDKQRTISDEDKALIQENDAYDLKRRLYLIDLTDYHSYDYERFYKTLIELSEGKTVTIPVFDEEKMEYTKTKTINPVVTPLILVDGYFIFKHQKIRDLLNFKMFKEVEDDVRLSRLILREEKYLKKNYQAYELYLKIYERFYKRIFEESIAPFKKLANVLLPDYSIDENNYLQDNEILRMIVLHLNHALKQSPKGS